MERLHTLFINRPHFRVVEKCGSFESVCYLSKMPNEQSNYCLNALRRGVCHLLQMSEFSDCSSCILLFMSIQCLLVKCDCSTFHALPSEKLFLEQVYIVSDVSRLQMQKIVLGLFRAMQDRVSACGPIPDPILLSLVSCQFSVLPCSNKSKYSQKMFPDRNHLKFLLDLCQECSSSVHSFSIPRINMHLICNAFDRNFRVILFL